MLAIVYEAFPDHVSASWPVKSTIHKISNFLKYSSFSSVTKGKARAMDLAMQIKEETFLREKDRLLHFIRSRVSTIEEAEDIMQDVFFQFVAGYETIDSLDRVTSWLFSVARNKIIDRYRRDAVRPQRTDLGAAVTTEDEMPLSLDDILPDLGNTPEDSLLRDVIWDAIIDA